MPTLYLSPQWFYGYDIILEAIFAIISLAIALFAFWIYQASGQKPAKFLGLSFLLISLAYVVQSVFNYLILSRQNSLVCQAIQLSSVADLDFIGWFAHVVLMLGGYIILVYMAWKPSRSRTIWLLLAITLIALVYSSNMLMTYYLVGAIYLAIISWHYIEHFLANKQTKSLLVALAFVFLFFGSFHFFLSVNHELFYILGQFLELLAYCLILTNLYLVLKK